MQDDLNWSEAHRELVPLMRPDDRTNIATILREYAGLAAVLGASWWAWSAWSRGDLPSWAFFPLAGLGVALVAAFQHRLSGLAHDASHYVLFRNRWANELASDLLLMFPIFAITQQYRAAHLSHHQHVNDPDRDADLIRLRVFEPTVFPIPRADFLRAYVLRGLWPPAILRYLFGRAKAANLSQQGAKPLKNVYRVSVARRMRGAYWLSVLATVHVCGLWPIFWAFWVLPLLTAYPFFMLLREIAHHSNAPDDGDLTNSRVFDVHPLLKFAVFPYGQHLHLTHHLFAMVPHYRLDQAHALLGRNAEYRGRVTVCRGYFLRRRGTEGPTVLDVLAARPAAPALETPTSVRGSVVIRHPGHDVAAEKAPHSTSGVMAEE